MSSMSTRVHDRSAAPEAHGVDLSVVLVNWNSLNLTADALASLEKFTKDIRYEVFVIDNGTTKDASLVELPKQFPWIHLISNGDNRGFSKANNQGIRRSKGRYILLLNNDTIQIENALGKAVAYMDAHPEVGALGINHLNHDAERSHQPSFFNVSPNPGPKCRRCWEEPIRSSPHRLHEGARSRLGRGKLLPDAARVLRGRGRTRRAVLHLRRGRRLVLSARGRRDGRSGTGPGRG